MAFSVAAPLASIGATAGRASRIPIIRRPVASSLAHADFRSVQESAASSSDHATSSASLPRKVGVDAARANNLQGARKARSPSWDGGGVAMGHTQLRFGAGCVPRASRTRESSVGFFSGNSPALCRHCATTPKVTSARANCVSPSSGFAHDLSGECAPASLKASTILQPLTPSDECIEMWAQEKPTGVTLKDLCDIGLDRRRRREHGVFLHRELRIRFSQRVLELKSLPYKMAERPGIRNVIRWYSDFVHDLEDEPEPKGAGRDEEFTNLLTRIFEEHSEVIQAMAFGVQDLMAEMGDEYDAVQPEVDAVMRRFFMARIGLRFLLQHHIESFTNREGHSGILQLECSPSAIAKKAAEDSQRLCRAQLGQSPQIKVIESAPATFTYVPMHLHYMLTEVFKNSCRAVVEQHADGGFDDALPPIRCHIVHGYEDVTIRISDEGGGISRSRMRDIWKFTYTTCKKSPWDALRRAGTRPAQGDSAANPLQRQRQGGVLAGYGVGLTLSRLYAQYFGGDLKILSLDGYGTDVYLHLSRLGTHCENLPRVVLYSPSMRDSSLLDGFAGGWDGVSSRGRLLLSADEEAVLRQELAAFRRAKDA